MRWPSKLLVEMQMYTIFLENNWTISSSYNSTFRILYWNNQTYKDIMQRYLLYSSLLWRKEIAYIFKKRKIKGKKHLSIECYAAIRIVSK